MRPQLSAACKHAPLGGGSMRVGSVFDYLPTTMPQPITSPSPIRHSSPSPATTTAQADAPAQVRNGPLALMPAPPSRLQCPADTLPPAVQKLLELLEADAVSQEAMSTRHYNSGARKEMGLDAGTEAAEVPGHYGGIRLLPLNVLSSHFAAALDAAPCAQTGTPEAHAIHQLVQAMSELYETSQRCVAINRAGNIQPGSLRDAAGGAARRLLDAAGDDRIPPQLRRLAISLVMHTTGHHPSANALWKAFHDIAAVAPDQAARMTLGLMTSHTRLSQLEYVIGLAGAHPDPRWRTQALANLAYALDWPCSSLGPTHLRLIDSLSEQLAGSGAPLRVEHAYAPLYALRPYLDGSHQSDSPLAHETLARIINAVALDPAEEAAALGSWIRGQSSGNPTLLALAERLGTGAAGTSV